MSKYTYQIYPSKTLLSAVLMLFGFAVFAANTAVVSSSPMEDRNDAIGVRATESFHGRDGEGKDGPMHKIGYELTRLYHEHKDYQDRGGLGVLKYKFKPKSKLFQTKDEKVAVDIVATDSGSAIDLARQLKVLGMENVEVYQRIISGYIPISSLEKVAQLSAIQFAQPAVAFKSTGAVTSQGDGAMYANIARSTFSVNGSGIKVGTLSDSYNCKGGAANDVVANELPLNIVVLADESGCSSGTDEGRAMMQIIHDLAPGSQQLFHTAFGGQATFANGITALANAGVRVINDDVMYYHEPMFQDGIIAQAIDSVKAMGVSYYSAAGNQASQSYESMFRSSGVKGYAVKSIRHDFDAGTNTDTLLQVTIPASTTVIFALQWQAPFYSVSGLPGSDSDLDIILYNSSGQALAGGTSSNIGGDPVEVFSYTNSTTSSVIYQLGIEMQNRSVVPNKIKLVYFGNMTINEFATNSSTLYGHAMATGAMAVGAARYSQTPVYGVSPPLIEYFSSRGGALPVYYDASGNPSAEIRNKPNIVAADGVDTTFFGSDYDGNGRPNFFGTSAAAPHAAAIDALLRSFDSTLNSDQIYPMMQGAAIDMRTAGFDDLSGYGLVNSQSLLTSIDVDQDKILGRIDNCPIVANTGQEDLDGDGLGNLCDQCPNVRNDDVSDVDADGLNAFQECIYGTNAANADTDGDGLLDGEELTTYFTDPLLVDSDSDGFNDYVEIQVGTNPNLAGNFPVAGNGDLTGDDLVDVRDMLLAQQVLNGTKTLNLSQLLRADVAPLVNGVPSPDGVFNLGDLLVITRKAIGAAQY